MAAMMKMEDEDEDGEEAKEPPPEEPEEEEEEEESEEESESESESESDNESANEAEVSPPQIFYSNFWNKVVSNPIMILLAGRPGREEEGQPGTTGETAREPVSFAQEGQLLPAGQRRPDQGRNQQNARDVLHATVRFGLCYCWFRIILHLIHLIMDNIWTQLNRLIH